MSAREDRLEEALHEIMRWANAYPADIFHEPDYGKARTALQAVGISMDGLHGSWARHLMKGVGEIASKALTE